jgi:predicted GIY-YIG superfamily endonuclease
MVWTVYILRCNDGKYYVGCTVNLTERIKRHTRGSCQYTKCRLPVEIITYTVFNNKYSAFHFEKYLKSGSGRAFMFKRLIPQEKA